MSYQNLIFLNLPVTELDDSIKFYTAIGFVQNKVFSNSVAAMMSLPAEDTGTVEKRASPINVMLLKHSHLQSFLPGGIEIADPRKVAQCLICLSRPSRDSVDEVADKAASNGGKKDIREKTEIEKQMEQMGMYGRVVSDPDGHIIELMYMPVELQNAS